MAALVAPQAVVVIGRRFVVLLTSEAGGSRVEGPWRDPMQAQGIAGRLQQLVDERDPTVEVDCRVEVVELEPWRGYRRALAWLLADPAVQL